MTIARQKHLAGDCLFLRDLPTILHRIPNGHELFYGHVIGQGEIDI
jgi:hypothetical protein